MNPVPGQSLAARGGSCRPQRVLRQGRNLEQRSLPPSPSVDVARTRDHGSVTNALLGTSVDALQTMIRNQCVNDGTPESGQEVRNADVIEALLKGPGIELERFEPAPGRRSLVARIGGRNSDAPSLCLNGHLDVVPAEPSKWTRDPFGGELIDGEIWGRGAVDMLNMTATMAVSLRHLADSGFRPAGDLTFLAVADEESGSTFGARWLAEHHPALIATDYVLTESGGLSVPSARGSRVVFRVAEKGVAWRRLRVSGRSGHGSRPYDSDNALVKAARVVERLASYQPTPRVVDLWREQVALLDIDDSLKADLLELELIDHALGELPDRELARTLHACTHMTFSPNVVAGHMKTNVIPSVVDVEVDIRTLPGDTDEDVDLHLRAALDDLYPMVEIEPIINDRATTSSWNTPLWESISAVVGASIPASRPVPQMHVGFTDARLHRELGSIAYGAGLMSPGLGLGEFQRRIHGEDERIDIESLRMTLDFWTDVVTHFMN